MFVLQIVIVIYFYVKLFILMYKTIVLYLGYRMGIQYFKHWMAIHNIY